MRRAAAFSNLALAAIVFLSHVSLLTLPYFWDELGQFVPASLDLYHDGAWVAHSTLPNVHPPGVMAYLALVYHLFGYSIPATRAAMLMLASSGALVTSLLAKRMGVGGLAPAALLAVSPLFFMQAMMAQLDMPAMVFTLLALLLFLEERYVWCTLACTVLVLMKETGLVAPALFGICLLSQRKVWQAAWFTVPALALAAWLVILHRATGNWLGNPEFAHYNVGYALDPVRMVSALLRRFFYLFVAEFRFIGSIAIVLAIRQGSVFRGPAWKIVWWLIAAHSVLVSVFGGAALERYLLPVLPLVYIAMAAAARPVSLAVMAAGLVVSLFWNPPYPFALENNMAMVDFVRLEQSAAAYLERNFQGKTIATAWPFTGALRRPEFGYVSRRLTVVETSDFHRGSVEKHRADVLVRYTRTWLPVDFPWFESYLRRYYDYEPDITAEECRRELGLVPVARWERGGQFIEILTKQ